MSRTRAARRLATPAALSSTRAAAGAVMLLAPTVLPRALGADAASARATSWAVQMLGVREVALGLGAVRALRTGRGEAGRPWVAAGLLCDAVDAVAVLAAVGRHRVRPLPGLAVVATAAAAAALELAHLRR